MACQNLVDYLVPLWQSCKKLMLYKHGRCNAVSTLHALILLYLERNRNINFASYGTTTQTNNRHKDSVENFKINDDYETFSRYIQCQIIENEWLKMFVPKAIVKEKKMYRLIYLLKRRKHHGRIIQLHIKWYWLRVSMESKHFPV